MLCFDFNTTEKTKISIENRIKRPFFIYLR